MEIIGYLKKQPKWKAYSKDGKVRTGYVNDCFNGYYDCKGQADEIDVPILKGTLRLTGFSRGRSSVVFIWRDSEGYKYETATKASLEMFKKSVKGKISGKFTVVKQGSQISLMPYEEQTNETK